MDSYFTMTKANSFPFPHLNHTSIRIAPLDWISIHWGWACQVLNPNQVKSLEQWTRYHLQLANQTL